MKTSELINKLRGLGFTVTEDNDHIQVKKYGIEWSYGKNLTPDADWVKMQLLLAEYYQTPLDERKPEKKYRLVLQEDGFDPWVLGYGISSENWGINNEDWLKGQGYQTRFTDDDLKKIADGDQDMLDRLTVLKREAPDNAD